MPDELLIQYKKQNEMLDKILEDYKPNYVYEGTNPIEDAKVNYIKTHN